MSLFDECYNTFDTKIERPVDWLDFWKKELQGLKKIPLSTKINKKTSTRVSSEINYTTRFDSMNHYKLTARFLAPRKFKKNVPLIVIFPDYQEHPKLFNSIAEAGFGQFVIRLRGHENSLEVNTDINGNTKESYGYFRERLNDKKNYYMKNLLLDSYRFMEMIHNRKEIDQNKIGVWGKGIGSIMALFVTSFMKQKIKSQLLQYPSFCNLKLTQNLSKAFYAMEIKEAIKKRLVNKKQALNTLQYFDGLLFTNMIQVPTGMLVNLEHPVSASKGAFSLFHKINAPKEMHIFTKHNTEEEVSQQGMILETVISYFKKSLLNA